MHLVGNGTLGIVYIGTFMVGYRYYEVFNLSY